MQSTQVSDSERRTRTLRLDDLSRMSVKELDRLYRGGRCPQSISEIAGLPRGRMLAVRGLDQGITGTLLRAFASSGAFPWGGKTFEGHGKGGSGINRVHLGGRHAVFPFSLKKAASVIDGEPCVMLDYDLPDNPWAIRHILDEVREVEPRLLLGPALWKGKGDPVFVLWFALDLAEEAKPIGVPREALS
jgi:hypothetical protein